MGDNNGSNTYPDGVDMNGVGGFSSPLLDETFAISTRAAGRGARGASVSGGSLPRSLASTVAEAVDGEGILTVTTTGIQENADFDAGAGQQTLASALIRAGDRGRKSDDSQDRAWYATDTSAWHASGELLDGSLTWGEVTVNRVAYFPNTGVFRLNEGGPVHLGETFDAGGRQPGGDGLDTD